MRKPERIAPARRLALRPASSGCRWATCCRRASPLHVSELHAEPPSASSCFAILALGIDLLWGYAGMLSLGHGVFFGLGGYAIGMHLMLKIGAKSVYQSALPDFMVWNQVKELPWFWRPFHSAPFTLHRPIVAVPALFALVFGFLAFRSRISGVYFSIITQALALSAWLIFIRNEMILGGTNGLADFKTLLGFPLTQPSTQRLLYVVTAADAGGGVGAVPLDHRVASGQGAGGHPRQRDARALLRLLAGRYKLFVFVVSAFAGRRGRHALRAAGRHHHPGQDRRAAVHRDGGVGGRGRPRHAGRRRPGRLRRELDPGWLTTSYPDVWLLFLGALFMGVVLFFPDGVRRRLCSASARACGPATVATAGQPSTRDAPSLGTGRRSAPPPRKAAPS